jgi:hypothetical protein
LGSRQAGLLQRTRFGAAVFHCARRLRVLLRDILRFGTGTGTLLVVGDAWWSVVHWSVVHWTVLSPPY